MDFIDPRENDRHILWYNHAVDLIHKYGEEGYPAAIRDAEVDLNPLEFMIAHMAGHYFNFVRYGDPSQEAYQEYYQRLMLAVQTAFLVGYEAGKKIERKKHE